MFSVLNTQAAHDFYFTTAVPSSPVGQYPRYKFVGDGLFTYDGSGWEKGGRLWGYIENYRQPNTNKKATGNEYKKVKVGE